MLSHDVGGGLPYHWVIRPWGPGSGIGAPCSVRAPARRGAPFLEKKGGKEPQGEGVSSPLDPSSLVGGALRAVPWVGSRPAAQAR